MTVVFSHFNVWRLKRQKKTGLKTHLISYSKSYEPRHSPSHAQFFRHDIVTSQFRSTKQISQNFCYLYYLFESYIALYIYISSC